MNNTTKSHGYESLMLILLAVVVVMTLFISAAHVEHIGVLDNIRRLFEKLQTS